MHSLRQRIQTTVKVFIGLAAILSLLWLEPTCAWAEGGEPGLVGKSIVVDAGHGGPDSGARSVDGFHEKDITLPVAMRLGALLQQAGATVHYTRMSDDDLATDHDQALHRRQNRDLYNRVLVAKRYHADVFISVHCNSVPSDQWSGAQTLYQRGNGNGELLAKAIQQQFRNSLHPTMRSAEPTSTLYLLKRLPSAAVIAEIGFLSNGEERSKLRAAPYQETVAYAIYLGVLEYAGLTHPQSVALAT